MKIRKFSLRPVLTIGVQGTHHSGKTASYLGGQISGLQLAQRIFLLPLLCREILAANTEILNGDAVGWHKAQNVHFRYMEIS